MDIATLIVLAALGQKADSSNDAAALVEKLGSASYAEREATKSLENLGAKALPALRPSLKSHDPEVRTRARALINKIEGNLLTQASLVRLNFKEATLDEIVKSISQQAGVDMALNGMGLAQAGTAFGARRVTLVEPQPVAFWKAIDRLCEVGQLTRQYQFVDLRGQGTPRPTLMLANLSDPLVQPSSEHGPFLLNVVSLYYTSRLSFTAPGRVPLQLRAGMAVPGGVAKAKAARQPGEAIVAGDGAPGESKNARPAPLKSVQFQVQLQVVPEPRMFISRAGSVQLLEAVDELGQSLVPPANENERSPVPGFTNAVGAYGMAGMIANLHVPLYRPETPGKLIKNLRGTVEVSVSAPRSNPLTFPLEGAKGKTFQNDDRRVVVNSIEHDPMRNQEVIALQIDDLDELFPAESVGSPVDAARVRMMGAGMGVRVARDTSQWGIQVVTSKGRNLFAQTTIDWDSGTVTLRLTQMPQQGDLKEVRISGMVRASAKIPFEFHDLPMP